MKPKEKAEELANRYRIILMDEDTDYGNEPLCTLIAIKGALIAVDEVTKYLEDILVPNPFGQYWEEVRKEIENL